MLVAWERAEDQRGHSVARLAASPTGWTADGAEVVAGPDDDFACTFPVELDRERCTVHVEVEDGRRCRPGRWRYGDDTYGSFDLTVDDGLVADDAGLARRVHP